MACNWVADNVFRPPCPTGGGSELQILGATCGTSSTTSSGSFDIITGLEVPVTVPAEGATAAIFLLGVTRNLSAPRHNELKIEVDGVGTAEVARIYIGTANENVSIALATQQLLGAGERVIRGTWRTDVDGEAQVSAGDLRLQIILGGAP